MKRTCLLASIAILAMGGSTFASDLRHRVRTSIPSTPKNEIILGYLKVKLKPTALNLVATSQATPSLTGLPAGSTYLHPIATGGWSLWQIPTISNPQKVAQLVRQDPRVVTAEPLNRIYALDEPNDLDYGVEERDEEVVLNLGESDPFFMRLWHLDDTNAVAGWGVYPNQFYNTGNRPLNAPRIAIIDTGIDVNHPDFANGGLSTNYLSGGQLDLALSKQFILGEAAPAGSIVDVHGHGTHVAGLALASGNNTGFGGHGVVGTGYNAIGVILRVFDNSGTGTDADAAAAIVYAADHNIDVINLSLGTTSFSQLFQDSVTYAWQKGCLVVAAGNENGSGGGDLGPIYPAACSGVLAVSANGPFMTPAIGTYSGYGPYVDIAAPGGDLVQDIDFIMIQFVWSTAMRNEGYLYDLSTSGALYPPYHLNYAYLAGTSMACPQVSGAAALYLGKNNMRAPDGFTNLKTYRALEKSSQGVMGAPYGGWEFTQGYGSLDVYSLLTDDDPRASQVGAVEGILYSNGTPTANVSVKAKKNGGTTTFSTTTRPDGGYRFEALTPGTYRVFAAPFGQLKEMYVNIDAGSDLSGFDFWCGTYFNDDTTAPQVVYVRKNAGFRPNKVVLDYFARDTETGVEKITARIKSGLTEVVPETEVVPHNGVLTVPIPGLSSYRQFTVTLKFRNGAGMVTTQTATYSTR